MTAEFNEAGVHFLYPENWSVAREDDQVWPRSISVHSPSGAFWSVTLDRANSADELLESVLATLREEYEDLEQEELRHTITDQQLSGRELYFYCLDLLIKAHVLVRDLGGVTAVLLYQAENRDFDQLLPVFDAISLSFLQNEEATRGSPSRDF